MFAYDYPVLGVFWSMFVFFLWIMWFFLLFKVIVDIFRSHDMGGGAKALWLIFTLIVWPVSVAYSQAEVSGRRSSTRRTLSAALSCTWPI